MQHFHTYQLGRINLHIIEMNSIQTVHSSFHIVQPINTRLLTHNSFIPYVLSNTSRLYPSQRELNNKLYDLYGVTISPRISTIANLHILSLQSVIPNILFLNVLNNTIDTMNELLLRLIFDPHLNNNSFDSAIVKNVKETMKNELQADQSSVSRHAFEQCIQTVKETTSISKLGRLNELELINHEILYKRYIRLLKTSDFHLYVVGNVQTETIKNQIEQVLANLVIPDRHPSTNVIQQKDVKQQKKSLNIVKDIKPVQQDLITIAMRLNTYGKNSQIMLDLFEWIFSGSFNSRMYAKLREENGLAYYIKGWTDEYAGLYVIQLGIDRKDLTMILSIINKELEDLKTNGSTEQEFIDAKNGLVNRFMKSSSHPKELIDKHLKHIYVNTQISPFEYVKQLMDVDIATFKQFLTFLRTDTIYYLGREDVELGEDFT